MTDQLVTRGLVRRFFSNPMVRKWAIITGVVFVVSVRMALRWSGVDLGVFGAIFDIVIFSPSILLAGVVKDVLTFFDAPTVITGVSVIVLLLTPPLQLGFFAWLLISIIARIRGQRKPKSEPV